MESCGQDMDKESADEFAGGEGHGTVKGYQSPAHEDGGQIS